MNDDDLPEEFFDQLDKDFHECDLLIVIGTSLKVEPFPGMIEDPPLNAPRVLINNEPVVTYNEELMEKNGNRGLHPCGPRLHLKPITMILP